MIRGSCLLLRTEERIWESRLREVADCYNFEADKCNQRKLEDSYGFLPKTYMCNEYGSMDEREKKDRVKKQVESLNINQRI